MFHIEKPDILHERTGTLFTKTEVSYGGPFWSKLNKIFSLLIELFVLAVYFILLYLYIYCYLLSRLFFVTFHEFLAHPSNYFFLQCTDYFWHPF